MDRKIVVKNRYIRLISRRSSLTEGYFSIKNSSNKDIVLVGVNSDFFKTIKLCWNNTIAKGMEDVSEIKIKQGDLLKLNDKGYFIKLIQPDRPLFINQELVLTLEFKDFELDYNFIVRELEN